MEGAWPITGLLVTQPAKPPLDAAIARIADRQHGTISLPQLKVLGLTSSAVRKRVQRGVLHPVHRGVYAVGRPGLTAKGRWMGAVLACGGEQLLDGPAEVPDTVRAVLDDRVPPPRPARLAS